MNVIKLPEARQAPKSKRSVTDTLILTQEEVESWKIPPFQRPLRINDKVRHMAEELKENDGVLAGVLSLGKIGTDKTTWVVDGQHRIGAFKISGIKEAYADVRIMHFDTIADMADEFVRLNSQLVKMRPDDILRGMEPSIPALKLIRERCEFVAYDQLRRNTYSGVISMGQAIKCWAASDNETPSISSSGKSIAGMAADLTISDAEALTIFLMTANAAWGREPENYRLWNGLNLTLCMWLYRRVVLGKDRHPKGRSVELTIAQFKPCLMSLAASKDYVDWLLGRNLNERDRRPAYAKIKAIFARRMAANPNDRTKVRFPTPPWAA